MQFFWSNMKMPNLNNELMVCHLHLHFDQIAYANAMKVSVFLGTIHKPHSHLVATWFMDAPLQYVCSFVFMHYLLPRQIVLVCIYFNHMQVPSLSRYLVPTCGYYIWAATIIQYWSKTQPRLLLQGRLLFFCGYYYG